MTSVPTERIRNVVLVGHHGAGTTALAEALMGRAGAVNATGGTRFLDADPESQKREMSLSFAVAPFRWVAGDGLEYQVNVLDTPGYPDFTGATEAAMSVADLVVLVVSAVDGVEVQSELLWRRAIAHGLPRMVFVSKEDRERADFHAVLQQLTDTFGPGFAPLELPIGESQSFRGVADVLTEEAYEYDEAGRHRTAPVPAELLDEEHRLHETVVEEIVTGDDDQLERYLSGDEPSPVELERTLSHEVLDGTEFPVLLGSSVTGVGIDRLADYLCELGPSPAERPVTVLAGDQETSVAADPDGPPLAFVFGTVLDPYVGQLSLFKVVSGRIRVDDRLVNSRSGAEERLHGLVLLRGAEQTPVVTELVAGDIAAVARLSSTQTFDTLAPKGTPVRVPAPALPVPHHRVAIVPRTQTDDDKLSAALARLQIEDPVLVVDRDDETHQTILRGLGDIHVSVTIERLHRLFGLTVDTEPIRVAYRETIAGTTDAEGKVKKQSGGHGQYALVNLKVSPLTRGGGFEFVDAIVGGAIPRNYVVAVEKGLEEGLTAGGPLGHPIIDVRVECLDGKFHSVDSSEMAFKTAAAIGLREALARAGSVILEPVWELRVTVPPWQQGDVMNDLSSRRGRVLATDTTADGRHVVVAHVPAGEAATYAVDLRSITSGRGELEMWHSHYDAVPDALAAKLAAP